MARQAEDIAHTHNSYVVLWQTCDSAKDRSNAARRADSQVGQQSHGRCCTLQLFGRPEAAAFEADKSGLNGVR